MPMEDWFAKAKGLGKRVLEGAEEWVQKFDDSIASFAEPVECLLKHFTVQTLTSFFLKSGIFL